LKPSQLFLGVFGNGAMGRVFWHLLDGHGSISLSAFDVGEDQVTELLSSPATSM